MSDPAFIALCAIFLVLFVVGQVALIRAALVARRPTATPDAPAWSERKKKNFPIGETTGPEERK